MSARGLSALCFVTIACGGGGGGDDSIALDAGPLDAAADAPAAIEPTLPAPPAAAARPVLTPCPAGWREVADTQWLDVVVCDPWPEGGPERCEGATAQFPGDPGCAPIGTACPADGWPAEIPEGTRTYWVDPAASAGGDGSGRASPYAAIADAVDVARDGDVIVLAIGRHEGPITSSHAVTFQGACAEGTVIAAPVDVPHAVLIRSQGGTTLRDVTIEGGDLGVQVSRTDGPSRLEDMIVRGSFDTAILVDDGDVEMVDVVVRDAGGPRSSSGLWAHGASEVSLDHVVVERAGIWGVMLQEGAHLTATALFVGHTLSADPELFPGDGLAVGDGATVELSESVIQDTMRNALWAGGPGTQVVVRDSVLQDVRRPDAEHGLGYGEGVSASDGCFVQLERVLLDRTHESALSVDGAGTVLEATDVVTRDTTAEVSRFYAAGFGLAVSKGARATLTRAALVRASGAGAIVLDPGSALAATDLTSLSTRVAVTDLDVHYGNGVEVNRGSLELIRAEVLESQGAGVYASDDSTLIAEDLRVASGGVGAPEEDRAQGVVVVDGAHGELRRVSLEGNRGCGMAVENFSDAVVDDLDVAATTPAVTNAEDGQGLQVGFRSTVSVARARIEDDHTVGVAVVGASMATIEDLSIARTERAPCEPAVCGVGGIGLQVRDSASVDVRRFRIVGNRTAGVQVVAAELDLHSGEVSANPIGANLQDESFDRTRLEDHVVWDNERNFDSRLLPLPALGSAVSDAPVAAGSCRHARPGDAPAAIEVEAIGTPLWVLGGLFQTSFRVSADGSPDELASSLTDLLAPNHLFTGGEIYWGLEHPPPYDDEWVRALQAAHCTSTSTFSAEELERGSFWTLLFTLVPLDAAPTGLSPDGLDLKIISDDEYPLTMSGDLFRNGELFDPEFDGPYAGMEDLGPDASFYEGFSHQALYVFTNTDSAPPGTDAVGHYELDMELLDDTGNGWHVTSSFDVE